MAIVSAITRLMEYKGSFLQQQLLCQTIASLLPKFAMAPPLRVRCSTMNRSTYPTVILGWLHWAVYGSASLPSTLFTSNVQSEQKERFVFKPLLYELLSGEMNNQVCPREISCSIAPGRRLSKMWCRQSTHRRRVQLDSGLCYAPQQLSAGSG